MVRLLAAALLGFVLLTGCTQPAKESDGFADLVIRRFPELKGKFSETSQVARVVDGDTFVLDDGRRVRAIGVNTPEIHGTVEHYGREAARFAEEILANRTVYLFRDVSETDRYGRLLRYVFFEVHNGPVFYNELLLKEGHAQVVTVPPDVMFADRFVQWEREARQNAKGLWDAEMPETACANPQIRGNINSRREKIYHVPGGKYYEATVAEQMFCTEKEAVEAGFRKSKG